jgi:NADH-quinone oxidoreductase subunit J
VAELIPTLMFYLFAVLTVLSGVGVISSRNPVYSVFFLIFAFFNAAGLFVLLGAEYLAMTLVIVYVGAVAVLFLFVVMMLNINLTEMREGFMRHLGVGIVFGLAIFAQISAVIYAALNNPSALAPARSETPDTADITNTHAIGAVLYTDYVYPFLVCGLILLVAMIGAIVLTLRHKPTRRQKISSQLARKRSDAMAIISVESGKGV